MSPLRFLFPRLKGLGLTRKPFQTLDHPKLPPCPSSRPAVAASELPQQPWGHRCSLELSDSPVRFVVLLPLSPSTRFAFLIAFEPWADAFIERSWLALAAAQHT